MAAVCILSSPNFGQVIFGARIRFLNKDYFYLIQFKITNRSESVVALNYLIELINLDWPSVWFIQPCLFSANQFRDSFIMVFMHQAIHFAGVMVLIADFSGNATVILIHDFLAESSFFDGPLN